MTTPAVRADAWVWAVRMYKSRTQATAACRAGHVRVNGERAKPATPVRVGDEVIVRGAGHDRIVEVRGLLVKRVGAEVAATAYVDHTPPPPPKVEQGSVPHRERGAGRPTKRERRQLDRLRGRR
jgi:ribosome-associated heat shock protein Hsp15